MSWPVENAKEKKNLEFKVENIEEEEGVVEGYASTFNNVDLDLDRIVPGAFEKSLNENKNFPILADHSPSKPIGINKTAMEDQHGLRIQAKFDVKNNQLARERFSFVKMAHEMGTHANFSIGFVTIKAEPDRDNPTIRNIQEVKLFETSHVVFPANTMANTIGAKFLEEDFSDFDAAVAVAKFIEEMKKQKLKEEDIFKAFEAFQKKAMKPTNGPEDLGHLIAKYGKGLFAS